jgi:hypothetical protein
MSNTIYVNFLPWITIYQSVTLGDITFWSFSREADDRIKDPKLKKRLRRHFRCYKNSNGSPNSITVCSFEGKSFYEALNQQEFRHLLEAISALAFAATIGPIETRVQKEQKHKTPPSMSAFDLITRQLDLSSRRYAHVSASLMDLGLTEDRNFFQRPFASRGEVFVCEKWTKYLSSYLSLLSSKTLKSRISRSLEFFRLAQAQDDLKDNSGSTTFLTRTVLLTTAFESLLSFPINGKADFFAQYIDSKFSLKNSRKSSRQIRRNRPKVQYSSVAWWAYDFYKLRNPIVHGNSINLERLRFKKDSQFSQMDVAVLVFADCLEELILNKRILKQSRSPYTRIADTMFESRGSKNWKKHHKVLGWIR